MMRSILAVLAGLVAGGLAVAGVEYVGHMVYPPPAGLDTSDPEAMKAMIAQLPLGALLFVLLAWALGSLAGGFLAAKIATRSLLLHGMIVGGILLIGGIANMLMIPHPSWFWAAGILVFPLFAYLGARLAGN